jgi:hypothetical protein
VNLSSEHPIVVAAPSLHEDAFSSKRQRLRKECDPSWNSNKYSFLTASVTLQG